MSITQLIGRKVGITISDPWGVCEECGSGPFYGLISDIEGNQMLILLLQSYKCQDIEYSALVCQARHVGFPIGELDKPSNSSISMNVTLIHTDVSKLIALQDSDFRNNIAAIVEVALT